MASSASVALGQMARSKTLENLVLLKMIAMSTLTKEDRGPCVHSMLNGDDLTAVEHLEFPEFAVRM